MKKQFDHIVYSLIEGTARTLFRGTWGACVEYVGKKPRSPFGGSTHLRYVAGR